MLSIIISVCGAMAVSAGLVFNGHPWWGLFAGIAFWCVFQIVLNLALRKRIEAVFMEAQQQLLALQNRISHKMTMLQQSGCADIRKLQELQEKELRDGISPILIIYDRLIPLYKWSALTERQVNTMKSQLYFQVREFERAEKLLKKSLALDSMIVAMKAVVAYRLKKKEEALKILRKAVKRFKGDKVVVLYALWSWMLVKSENYDEAIRVLVDAKERTGNETFTTNWNHLVNRRNDKFSNASLGEMWYSLGLELPKPVRQKAPAYMRQKHR